MNSMNNCVIKCLSDLMQELRKDALLFGDKTLSENLQTRDDNREFTELM